MFYGQDFFGLRVSDDEGRLEIWRYDGTSAYFYEIIGDRYRSLPHSRFFER